MCKPRFTFVVSAVTLLTTTLCAAEGFVTEDEMKRKNAWVRENLVSDEKKEETIYNACVAFREALKNTSKMNRFERIWAQQQR